MPARADTLLGTAAAAISTIAKLPDLTHNKTPTNAPEELPSEPLPDNIWASERVFRNRRGYRSQHHRSKWLGEIDPPENPVEHYPAEHRPGPDSWSRRRSPRGRYQLLHPQLTGRGGRLYERHHLRNGPTEVQGVKVDEIVEFSGVQVPRHSPSSGTAARHGRPPQLLGSRPPRARHPGRRRGPSRGRCRVPEVHRRRCRRRRQRGSPHHPLHEPRPLTRKHPLPLQSGLSG